MAEIVFVHGIDQQNKSAEALELEWLPALAGGVRLAGFPDIADRLWRLRHMRGCITARMAFYGNVFLTPGQQSDDPGILTPEEYEFSEALASEWLRHVAERSTKDRARHVARQELVFVRHELGAEQGSGKYIRSAAKSLSKISWFAPYGMGFAERFVKRALAQVTSYLTRDDIRAAALKTVSDLIGPETTVLIGHSLGSIVAYEATHHMSKQLPLLLTLGSPLSLQTVIYPRLRPQPPAFPLKVKRWLNVADRDDFVAARPDLDGLFTVGKPDGTSFEYGYTAESGAEPHSSSFYLGRQEVGGPVGELFQH